MPRWTRRMRERRSANDFRLLDNRRRANSLKLNGKITKFKTKENEGRAEAHKIERQKDEFKIEENRRRAEAQNTCTAR